MRMPELKDLVREHGLRNYSWLRKAELIAFLQDNLPQGAPRSPRGTWRPQEPQAPRRQRHPHPNRPPPPPPQMSTWEPLREPQTEVRQPE